MTGMHRADGIGSLRYSDEDCLTSERIGQRVAERVANVRAEAKHYGENVPTRHDAEPWVTASERRGGILATM